MEGSICDAPAGAAMEAHSVVAQPNAIDNPPLADRQQGSAKTMSAEPLCVDSISAVTDVTAKLRHIDGSCEVEKGNMSVPIIRWKMPRLPQMQTRFRT